MAVSSQQRQSSVSSSHLSYQSQPQSRSQSSQGRAPSSSSTSAKYKRRLTLDEELRDAHYLSGEDEDESGVLIGVGTRSKKLGFLAHGGAGGTPVFMGVGYVEGAEEGEVHGGVKDEEEHQRYGEDEDEYSPRTTTGVRRPATAATTTATASAKRRGRR